MRLGILAIRTLWWREITRFRRQRSRVIGALSQPVLFWLLIGGGLRASFRPAGLGTSTDYMEYFYPGTIALVMLFTAIFATITVVEDRHEGFLQGVLVAPISRSSIVLGQAFGATTLAMLQGALLLLCAPFVGIHLHVVSISAVLIVLFCLAFGMTNLGLMIAWRMRSIQGFHAIMNLLLMPLWLLSGAFFPIDGVPGWLGWLMYVNPLTYGMKALRQSLYLPFHVPMEQMLNLLGSLGIITGFGIVALCGATWIASQKSL